PKAGAQQEASEGEPGFLVVHRFFAAGHAGFQSWPESTYKRGIPFAFGDAETLLQALNQSGSGELISLAEAARKPGRDTSPGGFECIRRNIRPSGNRSPRNCLRS